MIADVAGVAGGPRRRRGRRGARRAAPRPRRPATNLMPATIALAQAGGTTGEWAGVLREVFGEYRAPTGVARRGRASARRRAAPRSPSACKTMPGGPPRLLVAKPGLDGHSNGAEQIAVAARDAGMEVVYQGIRLTPEQIAAVGPRRGRRRRRPVDPVGLATSSSCPRSSRLLRAEGVDAPVVVGGIIPEDDRPRLLAAGVAAVYTPKDFELARIIATTSRTSSRSDEWADRPRGCVLDSSQHAPMVLR